MVSLPRFGLWPYRSKKFSCSFSQNRSGVKGLNLNSNEVEVYFINKALSIVSLAPSAGGEKVPLLTILKVENVRNPTG